MHRSNLRRAVSVAVAAACSLTGLVTLAPPASAAANHLIITEVYGAGGNAGATLTHDFVELYNPTAAAINLDGHTVQYYSAAGNLGNTCTLAGSVAPGSYYLIQQAKGTGGTAALPTPDAVCSAAMSGSSGSVSVSNAAGVIDLVGYGTAALREGTATPALSSTTSASRTSFDDTDNNAADFSVGAPNPQNSGSTTPDPDPDPDPDPTEVTIAQIQGTGASTPLDGQRVTTTGVVTATYPTGGFNGLYIQTPGTGGTAKAEGAASDGIFVYSATAATTFAVGDCVRVTGEADEYNGLTQLSGTPVVTAITGCEAVAPTPLATLPATDAAKEVYEGMLVLPQGPYTITNNYQLNQYGQLGLTPGTAPLYQATDVVAPGAEAAAYEAANLARYITLDDGSSWDYLRNTTAQKSPLPYLSADEPMRTASQVTFAKPVILDYRFQWNYQPTGQIVGATDEQDPLVTENDREYTVPAVGGDVQIASFNVLNYFTDLGVNETGCRAYTDMNGNPVSTNNCQVRGAYSEAAFADQNAKIVAAINGLDAEVVALMEIENSAGISYVDHNRDYTLAALVDNLNAAAGEVRWAYAESPTVTPSNEDVIRTAFIYDPRAVSVEGPSFIDLNDAFANARYPLAQKFTVNDSTTSFVAIANHFKSKGSGVDDGTGQGLSNPSREAQATQLVAWAEELFPGEAIFLMGDFNAYSRETPVQIIEAAGYTNLAKKYEPTSATYQFSGRLGSLDHIFANEEALALVTGAAVWDINGDESIAFQYSRRHYNIVDFHAPDQFASSDHDAVIAGIKAATVPAEPVVVGSYGIACNAFGFKVSGPAPEGAKLRIEWMRDGQRQYTTVNTLNWWSGANQAGWSDAVATVLDADGKVIATSGEPINPDTSCAVPTEPVVVAAHGVTCNAFGFTVSGPAPEGAKLGIEWMRDGQRQYTTVNTLDWWSGANQTGWSRAVATVLDADGKVIATSGDPISPDASCEVPAQPKATVVAQRVTDRSFGFAVEGTMPEGSRLQVSWTDKHGRPQVKSVTGNQWFSGNGSKGWANAQAVLLDADGQAIATSEVINP